MKPSSLIAAVLASALLLGQATATQAEQKGPVVIELYTSQGCSSCPPADELLSRLALRSDVLPLALHVDYWDYIGWADSFARPEHTKRQKAYAHVAGSRTIYTPQMIIGGVEQIVGARPMEVADAVMKHLTTGHKVDLQVARTSEGVKVTAPVPKVSGDFFVQLVRYVPEETVVIERGENAGRTLAYSNVVTDWKVLAEWSGEEPLELTVPLDGDDAGAVIVQSQGMGPIIGAARLP